MKGWEENWMRLHPLGKQKILDFLRESALKYFHILQWSSTSLDIANQRRARQEILNLIYQIYDTIKAESTTFNLPFDKLWKEIFKEKHFTSREWLVLSEIERRIEVNPDLNIKKNTRPPRAKMKKGYLKG